MSILSSQSQGSTSSSSSSFGSPSQNPNPNYGNNRPSPPSPLSSFSGHLASAANDSGGSSEEVTEIGTPNASGSSVHQNDDAHSQTNNTGRQGVRSARSKGKMSRSIDPPRPQQSTGSINSLGGSTNSSGRRAQMTNANHLLNFHYDPIARSQPKPLPPPRRQQKVKPYNRDLFLQANYKFVVLDMGNYSPESMDPDKMLRWEDIICVRYSTPSPVQCPICLEPPLCPQITSCGHIFCFPCILRYLQMGEEDHKGDCFKRCPLCFVLVSQKDLYTIYIESVKQYSVGDTIEFMLLTREKDSFAPSQKNKLETDAKPSCIDDIYDPFSKFTFTSDVDLSVRKAISDLDGWLARADSGLVDDLEKLPYVCAAMEQLEHRKKYWNEQRVYDKNASYKHANNHKGSQERLSAANATNADKGVYISEHVSLPIDVNDRIKTSNNVIVDVVEALEGGDVILSSSYDEKKSSQGHSNDSRDVKERDSYNFYQAADGQHLIVHPINMKCLLHHYGSYDMLPHRIGGTILQLETVTQSEAMRRRYRYLSHFSLTTTFQLCEIDLSEILPPDALIPFIDEIKKREKQRKQLAKKDRKEKIKAEASAADTEPILYGFGQSHHVDSPTFSMDDFEALGSSTAMSSSPPIAAGRMLFSNVTRLGFAAAHDSPGLRIEDTSAQQKLTNDSSSGTGSRSTDSPSFANVISSAKSVDNVSAPKVNETGKKGKKPSRVLMSTAGGRRY